MSTRGTLIVGKLIPCHDCSQLADSVLKSPNMPVSRDGVLLKQEPHIKRERTVHLRQHCTSNENPDDNDSVEYHLRQSL